MHSPATAKTQGTTIARHGGQQHFELLHDDHECASHCRAEQMIPWRRSLLLGILAVVALVACTPLWMLAQMGRPVDFLLLWIGIGGPSLLLTLFIVKTRTVAAAIVCGLAFSIPIAAYCWILAICDPQIDYFKDMKGGGVATVICSIVIELVATYHRQLSQDNDQAGGSVS